MRSCAGRVSNHEGPLRTILRDGPGRSQDEAESVDRLHLYLALRQKNCNSIAAGQFLEQPSCHPRSCLPSSDVRPNRGEDIAAIEADARLRDDIRLLGRILGDTVRDQEGDDVFDLVERIRQTSIRFHRDDDKPARRELELILDSMSTSQTVRIVRAFSYFSHLANIAEDQHNIRQMRARSTAGGTPRPGTLAADIGACPRGRLQRGRAAQVLRRSAGQSGADRAPDRSPAQEHDRPRDGDRRAAGPARTGAAHAGRDRGQRRTAAPRRADAVADQPAAPDQAHRARRGRERAVLLRLHLPARGAAAALRAGGPV